jgi:DNA-binding transcriptional ArsR family regulator
VGSRRRKATPAEVRALAHPLRLRIIRLLYDGPRSNKELATRLDVDPATVLFHVRTLRQTGFVAPAGTRPGARGSVEKLYKTTGKSWKIDVDHGLPGSARVNQATIDAFLAEMQEAPPDAPVETARLALVISPERRAELTKRVGALLDEYALKDDPGGEPWAIFVAVHPRPSGP